MPKIKKEITPVQLRCSYGACPAVYLLSDGNLCIVGKKPPKDLTADIDGKVSDDEHAIMISREFFRGLFNNTE